MSLYADGLCINISPPTSKGYGIFYVNHLPQALQFHFLFAKSYNKRDIVGLSDSSGVVVNVQRIFSRISLLNLDWTMPGLSDKYRTYPRLVFHGH